MDIKFKKWLLSEQWKDLFGFDNESDQLKKKSDSRHHSHINPDLPIRQLDVESVIEQISEKTVRGEKGRVLFVNQIQWGHGRGAMRVKIHPDLHTEIAKLNYDLEGTPTWATKRTFVINRAGYGGKEDSIAEELHQQVAFVENLPLDDAQKNYRGLEKLVVSMADKMKRTARGFFVFEGIRKVDDNQYIIRFSVAGQGLEAPDQRRVIENQTLLYYDKNSGKIRLTNKNIESDVGRHSWEIMPSDTDVNFMPTQPPEEMVNIMSTAIRWY